MTSNRSKGQQSSTEKRELQYQQIIARLDRILELVEKECEECGMLAKHCVCQPMPPLPNQELDFG